MKFTISIFISSPGDVQDERETTEKVIYGLASEWGFPVEIRYFSLLRKGSTESVEADGRDRFFVPYRCSNLSLSSYTGGTPMLLDFVQQIKNRRLGQFLSEG